jgi:hypothetical protein
VACALVFLLITSEAEVTEKDQFIENSTRCSVDWASPVKTKIAPACAGAME